MDKKTSKIIWIKVNQIADALLKASPEAKSLNGFLCQLSQTKQGEKIWKALPCNLKFKIKPMPNEWGAHYTHDIDGSQLIEINQNIMVKNPLLAALLTMHEMCHHIQAIQDKQISFSKSSEKIFCDLLQEAEARVQDLELICASQELKHTPTIDETSFKTIPLAQYQEVFSQTQDREKTNSIFFKELLKGSEPWAKPWHESYLKNAIDNLVFFTPCQKNASDDFQKLIDRYAKKMNVSSQQLWLIYAGLDESSTAQTEILKNHNINRAQNTL